MWRLKNSNFQNSQVVHMMKLLILIQNPQIDSKVVMDDAPSYQKRKSLNAWFLWRQSIETPPSAHDRIRIEFSLYKSEAPTHLQKNVHQTKYHYSVKNSQILPKNSCHISFFRKSISCSRENCLCPESFTPWR